MPTARTVFFSYSHDSEPHKAWVRELADRLLKNGVMVTLDRYCLRAGLRQGPFMDKGLDESDKVICICTDNYIRKAEEGKGGAGYEGMILTAQILQDINTEKIIPVVRNVSGKRKMPVFFGDRMYVDMSDGEDFEERFR